MSQGLQLEGPEGLIVFRCGDRGYCCLEVLQAADFRGEVNPHLDALREGFHRARRAAALDLEVPEESLDALTEPFRYERNLITAEETERWLEERRLTLDDYEEHFLRRYWRSSEEELDEADPADDGPDPEQTRRLLTIDLQMAGQFHPMALRLAWRVAALEAHGGEAPSSDGIEEERRSFFERSGTSPSALAAWRDRLGCGPQWFEDLLRMEVAFRSRRASLLTREARERVLRTQRLGLTRLEYEVLELDSPDAAREAYLCAVEDGMSLQELAREARYPYARTRVFVDRLGEDVRQKVLSAKPGEVLPPTDGPELYQLCRVLDKVEPSMDDEEIRERIDEWLVGSHFAELAGRHVRWLVDGDPGG